MPPTDEPPRDESLDRGMELAHALTEGFLATVDALCEAESEIADPGMVIYSTWCRLTAELVCMGWPAPILTEAVQDECRLVAEYQADEAANDMGPAAGNA